MAFCTVCGGRVPPHLRDCVNGHANEYPNVRAAKLPEEVNALAERVRIVREASRAAGTESELAAFAAAASRTDAVMGRDIKALDAFVSKPTQMLNTYYQQVRSGARMPEDNYWDKRREKFDSAVNPFIYDQIHFAALSLSGLAPTWYGGYHVTLKEEAIKDRTTVFEMNPFAFFKVHKMDIADDVPFGFRATWSDRHLLVQAKLGSLVKAGMPPSAFADVVLDDKGGGVDADFVEVHIFGSVHVDAVARVVGMPKRGERAIWHRVKQTLKPYGVVLEDR